MSHNDITMTTTYLKRMRDAHTHTVQEQYTCMLKVRSSF